MAFHLDTTIFSAELPFEQQAALRSHQQPRIETGTAEEAEDAKRLGATSFESLEEAALKLLGIDLSQEMKPLTPDESRDLAEFLAEKSTPSA